MISITFDLVTGLAKLNAPGILKLGATVPVQVVFSSAPGVVGSIQLALGTDATAPEVLAYTEDFAAENATTWSALLDASDARLVAEMTGQGPTAFNVELVCTIDEVRQVAPNFSVTVQPAIIAGPESSGGGPVYLTDAQTAALYLRKAWLVKAANYSAASGERIQADTSSTAWTLTLPASPVAGDAVEIEDATASFATHNLTIARNGQKINNATSNYTAGTNGAKLSAVYISSGYGWSVK